ncbi:MAG: hypothetical protein MR567_05845 [Oscillospiraceae bacterium]|nr:hypothetical protein [Oscillospiraceae bacterium]
MMETEVKKSKLKTVVLPALISFLPVFVYLLFGNTPFAGVFVSVYTLAAFVLAYFSTAKKGTLMLNPFNLPAVGGFIAVISHLQYADICMSRFWIQGIFIFYGFWAVTAIGINLFNHDKGVSKRYHKLVIVVAFFFAVSCCSFLVNTAFDKSEPVTARAEIIRTWAARSGGNHRFLVSSDERPYGASLKSLIVNVSEQAFEDFEKGDTVSVSVRKGALGINYCRFVEDGYTGESIWDVQFE